MANMIDHILKLAQTISGEVPTDIPEVKCLRWLANMWPRVENPKDDADRMSNCIHLYCSAAADRMVAMSETVDFARTINGENIRLKAELEKVKAELADLKELWDVLPCYIQGAAIAVRKSMKERDKFDRAICALIKEE